MSDASLIPQQLEVICALSNGATITAAAAQAGIHRNTITNWRRSHPDFRHALADAHYHRAIFFREHAEELFAAAMKVVAGILDDPNASASVRLKAALTIINIAITPPAQPAPLPVHKNAQSDARPPESQPLHISAQSPCRRESPKIGRNETCPCGSGLKYKRCCLHKSADARHAPHP